MCPVVMMLCSDSKRYNDSVLRDELIHALALLVTDRNKEHKANLKEAKKTLLIEIMKGVCCISVSSLLRTLCKYEFQVQRGIC